MELSLDSKESVESVAAVDVSLCVGADVLSVEQHVHGLGLPLVGTHALQLVLDGEVVVGGEVERCQRAC